MNNNYPFLTLYITGKDASENESVEEIIKAFNQGRQIQYLSEDGWRDGNYERVTVIRVNYIPCKVLQYNRIKPLEFPQLPEGEEWHNPFNLTPKQIEVNKGYRLLLKSEVTQSTLALKGKCERYCILDYNNSMVWVRGWDGNGLLYQYRTEVPLPTKKIVYEY